MTIPDDSKSSLPSRLYGDVASPAAREVGATIGAAVHFALSPANIIIRTLQGALDYAEERIKDRFQRWKTPPGAVRQPPAEIVAPVIQALQYAGQDETLRDMYLTLLARAMDSRSDPEPHPSFAGILRQLSSNEAKVLAVMPVTSRAIPLLEVRIPLEKGGWHTVLKHVNPFGALLTPATIVRRDTIENFVRLGIIAIHEMHHLMPEEIYLPLEASSEVEAAKEEIGRAGGTPSFHRYLGEITDFGAAFLKSVVEVHSEDAQDAA